MVFTTFIPDHFTFSNFTQNYPRHGSESKSAIGTLLRIIKQSNLVHKWAVLQPY